MDEREHTHRAIRTVQCSACGCGWFAGLDPSNQPRAQMMIDMGWGVPLVPDCSGCPCHNGIGVLPLLRVTMFE
jgi:hypothetical protein